MPADIWRLHRRLQLFVGKKRKRVSVSPPVVGAKALAIAVDLECRLLLDRNDLSVLWNGTLEAARPVGWHRDDLHLLDEDWRLVVWDSAQQRQKWVAEGADRGYAIRGDTVLLIPTKGWLETRDTRTGSVVHRLSIPDSAEGFQVVGECCVLFLEDKHLEGRSLSTGERQWSLSMRDALGQIAPKTPAPLRVVPSPAGNLLLHWRPALGALDVVTGRFRWTRELSTSGSFCISQGHVGLLSVGRLFLCDEATGETVVDVSNATPTVWECPPITHEGRMVVVDEQGYIVTVALSDGTVLGVQKEKNTGFMGCVSVDGRLLVGGLDGALWVYEPAHQTAASAQGRGKAGVTMQPASGGTRQPTRGGKGGGARRVAASGKAKRS